MYMGHRVLVLVLGLALSLGSAGFVLFAQEGGSLTLPAELRRPQYGEAPRFPEDYWIGELGRGEAGEEAYRFARQSVDAIAGRNSGQMPEHIKSSLESLTGLEIRNVRIGGGRIEADGSVSFLVRFLGREEAVTGEIFLRRQEQDPENTETAGWYLDDLILDQRRPLGENRYGPESGDLTPYERFF
jgi:hypothetical protein